MRPQPERYQIQEGDAWFTPEEFLNWLHGASSLRREPRVHAIRFSDGSEWDCINGWRQDTLPIPPETDRWTPIPHLTRLLLAHLPAHTVNQILKTLEQLGAALPGPTAPTSTPSSAPSSESATPTASTSSVPQAGTLWAALAILESLPASFGWSLSVVSEQSNLTYEVSRPTAATTSVPAKQSEPWPKAPSAVEELLEGHC